MVSSRFYSCQSVVGDYQTTPSTRQSSGCAAGETQGLMRVFTPAVALTFHCHNETRVQLAALEGAGVEDMSLWRRSYTWSAKPLQCLWLGHWLAHPHSGLPSHFSVCGWDTEWLIHTLVCQATSVSVAGTLSGSSTQWSAWKQRCVKAILTTRKYPCLLFMQKVWKQRLRTVQLDIKSNEI
jgi:hypothetical protein